ncbi:MAG: imidazoleglycerol-phosphate dehydratase, partial [Nitrososphaera sp.]
MAPAGRKAKIERVTKETAVNVNVNLDGTGKTHINTRLSFIDHLITSIGKHAMIDITLNGESNDGILHHLA